MSIFFVVTRNTKSILDHACYAVLNASSAIFLASFGLTHFEKQIQLKVKDTSRWSGNQWDLNFPPDSMHELSQSICSNTTKLFGPTLSPHLLNLAAGISLLTSLYFATESMRHLKAVWKHLY